MRPMSESINMLTDQQLAKLFVQLQVPMALQAWLDAGTPNETARDEIQDMIGGQTPDAAMLSIALGALLLDAKLRTHNITSAQILGMSAEMMVQDYAPLYLEHTSKRAGGSLFDRADLDFLDTIAEDLESLADLLQVLADVLPGAQAFYQDTARVLAAQARAHMLMAETLVEYMGQETADDILAPVLAPAIESLATSVPLALNPLLMPEPSNVVPFRKRD